VRPSMPDDGSPTGRVMLPIAGGLDIAYIGEGDDSDRAPLRARSGR
jgi:hypothetical protein